MLTDFFHAILCNHAFHKLPVFVSVKAFLYPFLCNYLWWMHWRRVKIEDFKTSLYVTAHTSIKLDNGILMVLSVVPFLSFSSLELWCGSFSYAFYILFNILNAWNVVNVHDLNILIFPNFYVCANFGLTDHSSVTNDSFLSFVLTINFLVAWWLTFE